MNEAEYVFRTTNAERKRIGRGTYSKKRGSRSKKCTLPSDYLTKRQIKKMNGGVQVYNIKKPMKWTEFKFMPMDLQRQYLQFLMTLNPRRNDIAEMMGVRSDTIGDYIKRYFPGEFVFKRGNKEADEKWLDWITSPDDKQEDINPVETEEDEAPVSEPDPEPVDTIEDPEPNQEFGFQAAFPSKGSLSFNGRPEEIFVAMMKVLDPSRSYSMTIEFSE